MTYPKAPDLYPVTTAQLSEELAHIEVKETGALDWHGPITIITGLRHYPGNSPQPVVIVRTVGRGGMHFIALPGDD